MGVGGYPTAEIHLLTGTAYIYKAEAHTMDLLNVQALLICVRQF